MSVYGYLVCESSRQALCLGKYVRPKYASAYFDMFAVSQGERQQRLLAAFLSRNIGKSLVVRLEHEIEDCPDDMVFVGSDDGVSAADYLDGEEVEEPPE